MKDVWVKNLPPVGPASFPTVCNRRQAIAPEFGQLGSVPAGIAPIFCAHTLLLSRVFCQVASAKGTGLVGSRGFSSGLRKCVMISTSCPKSFVNRVASGRALLIVHEAVDAPTLVGRQT